MYVYIYIYIYIYIHIAIYSSSLYNVSLTWDLNPKTLNSHSNALRTELASLR